MLAEQQESLAQSLAESDRLQSQLRATDVLKEESEAALVDCRTKLMAEIQLLHSDLAQVQNQCVPSTVPSTTLALP